ncbi:hypothetical protein NC653_026681 [Populus alba x Populus x berolinensis]|uniref:chorismate synthase n=1 Tax=Populus alba x Populus x berolinensis TaxID=444605 RepID=A0AAD6MEP9_9ROSI|nr:hypothetical protein NC653_026681 [Populus alba x Populus x berolinensis]
MASSSLTSKSFLGSSRIDGASISSDLRKLSILLDFDLLRLTVFQRNFLRPGQSRITTPRKETDTCKISSGVSEGLQLQTQTYDMKYGVRSVQQEKKLVELSAGGDAKKILKLYAGTEILAYVSQVHKVVLPEGVMESNIVRCPDPEYAEKMIAAILMLFRVKGDSVGGVVTGIVRNAPRSFDKLEAELAKAAMSLPATKGFEFWEWICRLKTFMHILECMWHPSFSIKFGTLLTGSEHNDEFLHRQTWKNSEPRTNRSGGIQKKQQTVTRDKKETDLIARGRHDPCVVPRGMSFGTNGVSYGGLGAHGPVDGTILAMLSVSFQFPELQETLIMPRLEDRQCV